MPVNVLDKETQGSTLTRTQLSAIVRCVRWTATAKLADHLLPGGLTKYVADRRSAGRSWRRIALDIRDDTGQQIDVTHEALRSWFLGDEPNGSAAA